MRFVGVADEAPGVRAARKGDTRSRGEKWTPWTRRRGQLSGRSLSGRLRQAGQHDGTLFVRPDPELLANAGSYGVCRLNFGGFNGGSSDEDCTRTRSFRLVRHGIFVSARKALRMGSSCARGPELTETSPGQSR